jgi:protease II
VLVTTGTNDTRVEWWGPVKYAWRLRAYQEAPEHAILLSWTFEGHQAGDPNQVALEKTFLLQHLITDDYGGKRSNVAGHAGG